MQVTLSLPDELAQQIHMLPERDRFIRKALQATIQQRPRPRKPNSKALVSEIIICSLKLL